MEHVNCVTFNGDQNVFAYKVIMFINRLVDVLMKRLFKLDVSLMALWAVASWIDMWNVGSMEGDWGMFNKMSTCNVFFWPTMNQGCVNVRVRLRVGILLEMYGEGVHQYPVTPKAVWQHYKQQWAYSVLHFHCNPIRVMWSCVWPISRASTFYGFTRQEWFMINSEHYHDIHFLLHCL